MFLALLCVCRQYTYAVIVHHWTDAQKKDKEYAALYPHCQSTVALVRALLGFLPRKKYTAYMDNWYSSQKVFRAVLELGHHAIGRCYCCLWALSVVPCAFCCGVTCNIAWICVRTCRAGTYRANRGFPSVSDLFHNRSKSAIDKMPMGTTSHMRTLEGDIAAIGWKGTLCVLRTQAASSFHVSHLCPVHLLCASRALPSDKGVVTVASTVHACITGKAATLKRRLEDEADTTAQRLLRTVTRKRRDGCGGVVVSSAVCPIAVCDYSTNMGGVDLADQLRAYSSTAKGSKVWYHALYYWACKYGPASLQ